MACKRLKMLRGVCGAVAIAMVSGVSAHAVSAQTRPDSVARQDTVPKTPQELIKYKLKKLRPIGAPDSVPNGDSVRARPQQLQVNGGLQNGLNRDNAPGLTRDSIWESLLKLSGFTATEYKGDTATFGAASGNLNLRGNALVSREGQQVTAGRITYADSTSLVCAANKPRVTGGGTATPLESDSVCYDIDAGLGVARGATTSISSGALWRMYSATLVTRGNDYYSHDAIFTDCDLPWDHVHYAFTAKRVLARKDNVLVARDVTLRFADVPVFWLPFMVQSLSQGRRSGILMPRFGVNDIARTSTRYSRRIEDIGFYWAMNDFMGSELAFDWMSNNWTALRGSFDYNFLRQFLRGGVTLKRFWKDEGGKELTIASQNSWEPNERTRMNANVNYSTSSAFVRQRTFDPRELNRSIDSNFSMSRRLDWASLTFGASRRQFLSDNTVTQVFPSLGLQLSSVTLFPALPGEEHWFSNAIWTATAEGRREGTSVDTAKNTNPSAQTRRTASGSVRSTFTLGRLSLSQNFALNDQRIDPRSIALATGDSVRELLGSTERSNRWDVGMSYTTNLIGSTTFTPRLSLNGESLRNSRTNNLAVTAPARLDFKASLHSDAYRIFGIGAGPFEKFRHKISPDLSYTYSPKPKVDSLQAAAFSGLTNTLERNSLSIGLQQTFEAKYREKRDSAQIAAENAAADTATGPRRSTAARTVQLLSIQTQAVVYDFVQAREQGTGLQSTTVTNNLQSDLLQGFNVSFTHDLFRPVTPADGSTPSLADREFSLHLSSVNAGFRFTGNNWLFRMLSIGRRDSMPIRPGEVGSGQSVQAQGGAAVDRTQSEMGMIGSNRITPIGAPSGPVGSFTASVQYTLVRPRVAGAVNDNTLYRGLDQDQTIKTNIGFQPTTNWTVQWDTGYNITTSRFSDHFLTLTRRLHDWDANFRFVKAQNGNFSFIFDVHLRANPDIKLDWSQNASNGVIPTRTF